MSFTEYHNDKLITTASVEFIDGNLRDRIVVDIDLSFDGLHLKSVIEDELVQLGYKVRK
jgi:hypothetical protein